MNWRTQLERYNRRATKLFDENFLQRWGDLTWEPNSADKTAAAGLHVELASRVTTQKLGYAAGVEGSALASVFRLFEEVRTTARAHVDGRHFEVLSLHVLNVHLRPFTAKWHRRAEEGALVALDASDEFRADLAALRTLLCDFDDLLVEIRDGVPPPAQTAAEEEYPVRTEMRRPLRFGIPDALVPAIRGAASAEAINKAEGDFIAASREARGSCAEAGFDAVGLALSGGGIRSATFSLGVLIALARRNVLTQVDYLSTVSGGGYLGSFMTTFLSSPEPDASPAVGLGPDKVPFKKVGGEAAALRHLRHHSRYLLTGSWPERIRIGFAQLYGIFVNILALVLAVFGVALVELGVRIFLEAMGAPSLAWILAVLLGLTLLWQLSNGVVRHDPARVGKVNTALSVVLAASAAWMILEGLHAIADRVAVRLSSATVIEASAGVLALVASALGLAAVGRRLGKSRPLPVLIFAAAAPLIVLALYLAIYQRISSLTLTELLATAGAWLGVGLLLYTATDVNLTSLHQHYRDKLSGTFLIRRKPGRDDVFETGVRLKLSEVAAEHRGPYPLVNGALNVPGSRNAAMQGRLTDFFLFSPEYTGSPIIGYRPTSTWEEADPELDVATAMAISGAAASPQAGLLRLGRLSFWLALLNVRLGYWVKVPGKANRRGPGLRHLLQEMFGTMDERGPLLNVSDGGHIENLGVYELIRRRCKYIVAVDGEQDPQMTFHALTNLQRLAAIDMDVKIDIDLDDLRLDATGLSRSHFKFCRIHYPGGGIGYLMYVKLSLTGNEGEFIRRYRLDEPAFPHHSTRDQFFTEAQFEAYRTLGEHVGDKLFLSAIVGSMADASTVGVAEWFEATGQSLLEPG